MNSELSAKVSASKLASSIKELADGTKIDVVQLEVTSDERVAAAVKTVGEKYSGELDVLFSNEGTAHVYAKEGEEELSEREQTLRVYDTNVVGVSLTTKAFLPLLLKSKTKRVMIMSSDVGSVSWTLSPEYRWKFFQDTIYKPSKAAVNMVGAALANLYKDKGLSVYLCDPGFRQTAFNHHTSMTWNKAVGAIEAARVIAMPAGEDREVNVSFTENPSFPGGPYVDGKERQIPW